MGSRLKGHSLLYGGRCGTNIGPARCSCGAQSQISYSTVSQRQAWHRAHKASVAGLPSATERCLDCDECAKHAYSDASTPGFFSDKCSKHRKASAAEKP